MGAARERDYFDNHEAPQDSNTYYQSSGQNLASMGKRANQPFDPQNSQQLPQQELGDEETI